MKNNKFMIGKAKFLKTIYAIVFSMVCGLWSVDCFAQEQAGQKLELEKIAEEYFAKNDYDGFYQYLKSISSPSPEVYYFLALARQKTIEYWQQTKNWEGVYDKAAAYKKNIDDNLKSAEGALKDDPGLLLKVKYLKWIRAKEDGLDISVGLFNDLVNTAKDAAGQDCLQITKDIADELSGLEDKNLSRRLYEIYVNKLIGSDISGADLKKAAVKFLNDNNIYLAKTLFGAFLSKISDVKALLARETVGIAGLFAHQGRTDGPDPVFAEEMYKKAYDLSGAAAFDSGSQYRRAFNLERMKEFERAIEEYKNLLELDKDYGAKQKVLFRLGVLTAYAAKNVSAAEDYFLRIKDEFPKDILARSSLYQLGLLSQFHNDLDKAKEYYSALLEIARSQGVDLEKNELALLAQERLGEIEEKKEMKYGLKLFLEGILGAGDRQLLTQGTNLSGAVAVDLTAYPCEAGIGQPVKYVVTMSNPQTGCMTPAYAYEWSGETGGIANIPNSPELVTDYATAGIKVVHVAVVGPQGPDGEGFDMVEIN